MLGSAIIGNVFTKYFSPRIISALLLLVLIGLTFVTRLAPTWSGNFSFAYDNAKDSLVIMEMGTRFKPALFGAVTSIPGVYNGPLYYYLALPLNVLFGYHPIAGVLTVVVFSVLSMWLAYKAWGFWGGFLYATSIGVIGAQQSAWSPYMTVFITLPVIILLQQLAMKQKKSGVLWKDTWQWLSLFGLISASFHFQTAFGVVLLPLVILILAILKVRPSKQQVLASVLAFAMPFMPLVAFELRHSFHQTKQVIAFIQNYGDQAQVIGDNQKGVARVFEVGRYMLNTAGKSVVPLELPVPGEGVLIVVATIAFLVYLQQKSKKSNPNVVIWAVLLFGPLVFYLVLPVKEYYLVALVPVWVSLFAYLLQNKVPLKAQVVLAVILSLATGIQTQKSYQGYQELARETAALYQPKADAVALVYELADGRPFNSYQFVPEIYDYTYQHIYLQQYLIGRELPQEFSYAPGEVSYIQQKHVLATPDEAVITYLIVEPYVYQDVFENWKNRVAADLEIINEYQVNQGITVYEAIKSDSQTE